MSVSNTYSQPRWALLLLRILACILGLTGLALLAGGIWLVSLHGSFYYLITGIVYLIAAVQLWRLRHSGAWLVGLVALLAVPWALWERGLDFWALFPRLLMPMGFAAVALLLMSPLTFAGKRRAGLAGSGILAAVVAVVILGLAFMPHGVISPVADASYKMVRADTGASNWYAYGRTTAGTRYAPFDQINRDNVDQLQVAWSYRTGWQGKGVDQNTPLQIGNLIYSCTPENVVTALDADSGKKQWQFDPHAKSPFWQRCRGLGYYPLPQAQMQAADTTAQPGTCTQRIVMTTIDARLIEIDAHTGEPCQSFGDQGTVKLSDGMGEVAPGFYFQTSAPLVAGDVIVIGGWVVDNQMRHEPSGVIRAFNARTGKLAWAWDLGNTAITGYPPAGETYTRGTPNMWTTASYDPKLGLIYLPLGNETPDYFGGHRLPISDKYNSSIVALDVKTGREVWHFQTVHHDIWDYDLPSQPALMDLPDGQGGTIPALLQTTKRGQLFLLNRKTGKPIAEVAEKPVPQDAVPGEYLSPTQPYSVGMPTIGGEHLTEHKMWGATMLDQLWCRIRFHQLRYEGDFTPIGLTPTIEQPGNVGGFNWGSVSYDPVNHLAYVNDIRVPSLFWLAPREQYTEAAKRNPRVSDGHGPSPMKGTPYGVMTFMWFSPIGTPCVEPPFGTITAVDMVTHKIAWQVPAGTTEQRGPFDIASHLPMKMGMPTYAGTITTAGGLVFFAGFQDYYLRAYDAQTGELLWKHPLPVGSSATPMTYVSPKTGRQYVVISAGGAAYSKDIGDYLIAFALPDKAGK